MEVDEAPQEEDVSKAQKPCELSEEEEEAEETGKTVASPPLVTESGEHPPETSHNDNDETSGEEGELSMSEDEEDSPQRNVEGNSESGTQSELHSSDQLPEDHREGSEAGAESDLEHATPSSEDNRSTNCSTIPTVDKDTISDRTQEDEPCLAKNSLGESEDHITSENPDRNVDDNIDLLASGDNDNVYHDKKCTKTSVNSVEKIGGDVGNENEKVVTKNEKQRVSKTSLHDEPVELDYEEEGIEDSESLANTGGDDSKELETGELETGELETGELDEKEEGEHSDDSGELSDDKELDDGEVVDDDDCEEGEIKDNSGRRPFTRYVCRFYLRGHCTWGPNCRFVHPGVNDKGNYSMMDQPYMQGPPGRGAHRGPIPRGHPGPWADMPAEPDLPPPPEDPPTETAWERGLRQAKELRMKASKRKEMEVDFEEKRMHLTLEEEKDHNKENEERSTRSVVNKDPPPYYEPYELDEYYDKEVHDSWRLGQYENFEVRWNREPAEYPAPYNRGPEKERMVDKRRNREMVRYSPGRRVDRRKEKGEKHDYIRRSDKPEQHSAPTKARVDEWQDPWQRTKSPKRKRSSTRSRSRGRPRARRSNSRGSFSSSYSSSSFSSRSRSSSSYSSYSSRSSASRSSSFSSRSSSRSKSRSPRRHNWKQSGTMAKGGASSKTNDAVPKSTVSRLGHSTNQGAAAGTLGAAIAAERKKAAQPPAASTGNRSQQPGMRGQPSGGMRGQPPGMRGQPPGMRGQSSGGMRGQPPGNTRPQPPSSRTQNSASSRGQPPSHAPSRASANSRSQPPSSRAPPSGHTTARPQPSAASRGQPPGVATLRTAPVKGPSPVSSAAAGDRSSRKPHRHAAMSPRERGRRSGSSSDSSHSSSVSRSSSASSIDSSTSASSGSADSEHLYRDIGSPAGSKQTVSPKKKVDKVKRDAADEKKEPKVKPKDSEKKSDKVPSGNTAGRKELYNSGRTDAKAPPPGKSASTKGAAKNSSKQQAKVPPSSSTSASATDKASAKLAAAAVRMQVKSTSLLKQPARMPERSDSKTKLNTAPAKQDEKSTASRNSDEKVSSSTKSVPRTAPALQAASVPATLSVQPAKTKDLLKVAGQKSSIKLTLISKSEKASSRKRPAPDSDAMSTASPVKRPAKPPVHGVTKENTVRHPEKATARPNSPKGKAAVPHRPVTTSAVKNTANASGGTSAPKKSMSSRREELLKQLKAVEDAIARKRAKMN